ncbi:MAG: hypothetical protein JOS17DRAFT_547982 [Linnemannia elongata]|nr:MAG: hypothetical protein JOS17DRAFT_547982 [Linnemannia elongata]
MIPSIALCYSRMGRVGANVGVLVHTSRFFVLHIVVILFVLVLLSPLPAHCPPFPLLPFFQLRQDIVPDISYHIQTLFCVFPHLFLFLLSSGSSCLLSFSLVRFPLFLFLFLLFLHPLSPFSLSRTFPLVLSFFLCSSLFFSLFSSSTPPLPFVSFASSSRSHPLTHPPSRLLCLPTRFLSNSSTFLYPPSHFLFLALLLPFLYYILLSQLLNNYPSFHLSPFPHFLFLFYLTFSYYFPDKPIIPLLLSHNISLCNNLHYFPVLLFLSLIFHSFSKC